MKIKSLVMMMTVGISLLLASCGSASVTTYSITGTISGLSSGGLVLQNNSGNNLPVSSGSTSFIFTNAIAVGAAYNVTVLSQPSNPAETCVVTFGSGTVAATVTDIQIICADNTFTLGGTVSGLSGTGLVLQDNGGTNLTITANGSYTFPTPISRGAIITSRFLPSLLARRRHAG